MQFSIKFNIILISSFKYKIKMIFNLSISIYKPNKLNSKDIYKLMDIIYNNCTIPKWETDDIWLINNISCQDILIIINDLKCVSMTDDIETSPYVIIF